MLNKFLLHAAVSLLLVLTAFVYFSPIVFEGKSLSEHDNVQARAGQTEIHNYLKEDPKHTILWTNRLFVGMPTYIIQGSQTHGLPYEIMAKVPYKAVDLTGAAVHKIGGKKRSEYGQHNELSPHIALSFLLLSAYLALMLWGLPWYMALLGALSFGLITNNLILMEAGHSTKIHAMFYTFPILAAAWTLFRKNWMLGLGLFAFFLSVQIRAYHIQITYYTLLTVGFLALAELFRAWKSGQFKTWIFAVLGLGLGAGIGVLSNSTMLWQTYEYSQESIRGKSELKAKAATSGGLDKDYIFQWSLGKLESMTLFIPHFYGGGSAHKERPAFAMDKDSETYKALGKLASSGQIPAEQVQQAARLSATYWGAQPFTAGPIYYGAVVCFLFFLGLFAVRGPEKWWLAGTLFFFLVLAWGKHFAGFNNLMVDYFPMYNKFRAVTMTLTAAEVLAVLLGILGLKALTEEPQAGLLTRIGKPQWDNAKGYVGAAAALAGALLLFALMFSYMSRPEGTYDAEMLKYPGYVPLVEAMEEDRASLLRSDVFRTLFFVAVAAGLSYLLAVRKASAMVVSLALAVLSMADLWSLGKQYVNDKSFVTSQEVNEAPEPSPAAKVIMQDKALHFRVLDLSMGDPFTNAMPSFYYNSLGGYSAAKPRLYQDVSERYFSNNDIFSANRHILQMLNVKYLVNNPQMPVDNQPFGNAWFVPEVEVVADADAEIAAIGPGFDPLQKAVVQERFRAQVQGVERGNPNDRIYLDSYHPEKMVYKYQASAARLAMFSELYYPPSKGWKVFLDGQPIEEGFIKANYLIRALKVPAGEHVIEMRFEPRSFYQGENFSLIGSVLCLAVLGFALFKGLRKSKLDA